MGLLKKILKKNAVVVGAGRFLLALKDQCRFDLVSFTRGVLAFRHDLRAFRAAEANHGFSLSGLDFIPCLTDRTATTPVEPIYFYQDTWAAGKLFQIKPERHCDVGSSTMLIGIVSQFVPTTMVDIRPVPLALPGLSFRKGSILDLPFEDGTVVSLSSLCVVEHIGLGRYGDPIDPWGSEKAARELERVLVQGGDLLFSVPVDRECRIYFNAHRAFTRRYVLEMFAAMELVEERYIYGTELHDQYDPDRGFGTGLYHLRKR